MKERKTEWIHVRVTKDMKDRILRFNIPITDFVIDAISFKLAIIEAETEA